MCLGTQENTFCVIFLCDFAAAVGLRCKLIEYLTNIAEVHWTNQLFHST